VEMEMRKDDGNYNGKQIEDMERNREQKNKKETKMIEDIKKISKSEIS
jgi:hypothetical protein